MKVVVVGTGYVGLVCAATFAEMGHRVIGIDIDAAKIERLQRGECPIHEPHLEDLLRSELAAERLTFSTDLAAALHEAEIVFSAVPTPTGPDDRADLSAVFAVTEAVAQAATGDLVFINKSTVPVGTGQACQERIDAILAARGATFPIVVASNPEFLQEGSAVLNARVPHRIVVGIDDGPGAEMARERLAKLYAPLTAKDIPYLVMDRASAEVVKYASNAFLATKISFINMMSELCEKTGADVRAVAAAMGEDPRIGRSFLQAGIGYGGSCFPKDIRALIATGDDHALDLPLIRATQTINERQRRRFFQSILEALDDQSTVAVWGLSFKPNTDDVREAASLELIPLLLEAGHTVRAFDPAAHGPAARTLGDAVHYADDHLAAATGSHAVVLLTEWPHFADPDWTALLEAMEGNLLFDGRNLFDRTQAEAAGFAYRGLGV